ncbi:glycine betaine ABC transporter substrate-binding protein [Streptomyces pathocidini]|uniref:Glycine betaine ABC transporter substrate-binding protein n=1 Tax=Streptomyces pathocidini TaxID=1650571 RepID=A0ABW7UMG7_9ACTN|nr:glycine betaine ABC transporter substrate-binding protein [Streptomyces pathocidini]
MRNRNRNTTRPRRVAAASAAAGALLLSGCGLQSGNVVVQDFEPGSIGQGRPLEGVRLGVTSKEFSEQLILGQILALSLTAAGAEVSDLTNIQGSMGSREAVKSGTAAVGYEYTGTGWINFLGHTEPIADPQKQWKAVRDEDLRNGLTWLPQSTLNNTYAMALNQANARKYGLRTLSDVAELAKRNPAAVTLCVENEFAVRGDGLRGMLAAYGIELPAANIKKMQTGLIYTEAAQGRTCTLGEVYTTDGRIGSMNLAVLKDDKRFFPNYNVAPVVNSRSLKRHPQLEPILNKITAELDTRTAQRLNAKVDVEGQEPRDVAKEWLLEKGFIKE